MNSAASVAVLMAALGGTPEGVILDFSASWCPGCQRVKPTVQKLQKQGLPIRIVDVDRERALVEKLGVQRIPTFILLIRDQVAQRVTGPMSERELREMAKLIPIRKDPPKRTPPKLDEAQIIRGNDQTESAQSITVSRDPREVCTRIRVRDSQGMDIGSGTVIHSQPGRTLILTCGHIFRHFDQKGRIEVDVFQGKRPQMFEGKLVHFRLEPDIGLISIPTPDPVSVARIAVQSVRQGQHVFSVGCGGGDPPSRLQHRVTDTQHYQGGYIECTGVPRQGRSGGGLFTLDGQVAGVCVFANPDSRRGLYTGLDAVHRMLDQLDLASLYRTSTPPRRVPLDVALNEPASEDSIEEPPFGDDNSEAVDSEAELPAKKAEQPLQQIRLVPVANRQPVDATKNTIAFEEDKFLEQARGAEIVCVIRPRKGNESSRVVIIHRATDQFLQELSGELRNQMQPTSLPVRPATRELFVAPPRAQRAVPGGEPGQEKPTVNDKVVRRKVSQPVRVEETIPQTQRYRRRRP